METITLDKDIQVIYVPAGSFPDGILEAHQKLHSLIPFSKERRYFGISRPENGIIKYKAAAEEIIPGEGKKINCDTLVLKKGRYISLTLKDYMKDLQSIARAFQELLKHPELNPESYCVEWYLNDKDVKCMVRLTN
jgi:hypothetical protein